MINLIYNFYNFRTLVFANISSFNATNYDRTAPTLFCLEQEKSMKKIRVGPTAVFAAILKTLHYCTCIFNRTSRFCFK